MSTPAVFFGPDPIRTRLRATMNTLDVAIDAMGAEDETRTKLRAIFKDLDSQLALGPEPPTKACAKCGCIVMKDATVCGMCWNKFQRVE